MAFKTFGDCYKEVLRYGFNDGPQVNKERIENWINEGQLQVARTSESTTFQETATISMTVGKQGYAQPTGFLRVESLFYPKASVRLKPIDLQTFDSQGSEVEGTPFLYTIFKTEILLYPTPSVADTLTIRYLKKPARMTLEGDTPTLPEDYLHILVDYALWRAYRAEDDFEAATMHENQYKADLAVFTKDTGYEDRAKQLQGSWST